MSDQDDESVDTSDNRALLPFEREGIRLVRRQWHDGQWHFSVVDVIGVLTENADPGNYWSVLKRRMLKEGANEVVTNCHRLKMRSLDGKMRETDAANAETMLRIVQSVPSPKAEPIKQWLAELGAQRLDEVAATMEEAEKRLLMRGEVADKNTKLNSAAANAGLMTTKDFAVFHDHGYMGLYGGETSADIQARKGLARGEHILDWMGSEELAANWFRITQAEAKLRREGIDNKGAANAVHFTVGQAVRNTIAELGGAMPEDLPTTDHSIKELQRLEQRRVEAKLQPSLFDENEQ